MFSAMMTPENGVKSLRSHDEYYLSSGDLFLLVENYHFRVHRYFFERESKWFQAALCTPASPGGQRQGTSESNAIVLDDVTQDQFRKLCWVFYNPKYSLYEASVQDWSEILALAERWTFPEVKALCVRELEKHTILDVDRIVLYHQYHVDQNLLVPCYAALISREYPLTLDEGIRLGMEIALNIGRARECARANPTSDGIRSPTPCALGSKEVEAIVKEQFKIEEPPAPEPIKPAMIADDWTSGFTTDVKVNGEADKNSANSKQQPNGTTEPSLSTATDEKENTKDEKEDNKKDNKKGKKK